MIGVIDVDVATMPTLPLRKGGLQECRSKRKPHEGRRDSEKQVSPGVPVRPPKIGIGSTGRLMNKSVARPARIAMAVNGSSPAAMTVARAGC